MLRQLPSSRKHGLCIFCNDVVPGIVSRTTAKHDEDTTLVVYDCMRRPRSSVSNLRQRAMWANAPAIPSDDSEPFIQQALQGWRPAARLRPTNTDERASGSGECKDRVTNTGAYGLEVLLGQRRPNPGRIRLDSRLTLALALVTVVLLQAVGRNAW